MRKTITILITAIFIQLVSCTYPWEDRFKDDSPPLPDKSVWQVLNENTDYSEFVNLLEETNYDSILQRNTVFTVFVPVNANMQNLDGFSNEQKKQIAAFHISNGITYDKDMNNLILKSLVGKSFIMYKENGNIILNNLSTVTHTDIPAINGVIHEISSLQMIRPNLYEFINSHAQYSYVSDFFSENTEIIFDEANSIPIGIDSIGQTIYDSVFIYHNDFFSNVADISSEEVQYSMFLLNNTLLDTTAEGSYKLGFINNLGNFIIQGPIDPDQVPDTLTGITGFRFPANPGAYRFIDYASNGEVFELTTLAGIKLPHKVLWEITDISEFDSIRHIRSVEYKDLYDQFTHVTVHDLEGGLLNFKYEKFSGPLNKDYFKITTTPGTYVTIHVLLPDIITPGKYNLILHAQHRNSDGAVFDCYLNDELVGTDISLNGGLYTWDDFVIGTITVSKSSGNYLDLKLNGSNDSWIKLYLDYLIFEPAN